LFFSLCFEEEEEEVFDLRGEFLFLRVFIEDKREAGGEDGKEKGEKEDGEKEEKEGRVKIKIKIII
jgi:hypothetical protein